ncbi:MAG: hypothetical protein ACO32J_07750 [Phycisphaerales bacterium]|jgi:hypothetical protein
MLVLCPTHFEASHVRRLLQPRGLRAHVIGVGGSCEPRLRAIAAAHPGPHRAVLVGIAGALRPQAAVGTAYQAERVIDEFGATHLPSGSAAGPRLPLLCARDVVVGASAREAAASRSGAAMVDMECGPFARVAAQAGWRWAVVRGISDDAAAELPPEVMRWLRLDGRLNVPHLAADLLRKPRLWGAVRSMHRHASVAMRGAASLLAESFA